MVAKHAGGCAHVHVTSDRDPIDNHVCHCNVCKAVTGQQSTHVAFFAYDDLKVDHPEKVNSQPYNKNNPDGPLSLWTCKECGAPIMVEDSLHRIRVAAPAVMGYGPSFPAPTYHAFWDESKGYPAPKDGRPVYEGLRPEFTMPPAR